MFKRIFQHSAMRYLLVGGSAFLADYLTLLFLYQVVDVPLFVATSVGFFVGFAISFATNKQWAFGGKHQKKVTRQIVEYFLLAVFNYVFTVQAVAFLNQHGIPPYAGKLVVMVLIVIWNYALFRWVIFAHERESKTEA